MQIKHLGNRYIGISKKKYAKWLEESARITLVVSNYKRGQYVK